MTPNLNIKPDIKISVKQTFGIDSDMEVSAFSKKNELVPEIDKDYKFDRDTTLAILSGFNYNKRVIVLKSEEIRMIEDEWWGRFNKNYNINTNKVG